MGQIVPGSRRRASAGGPRHRISTGRARKWPSHGWVSAVHVRLPSAIGTTVSGCLEPLMVQSGVPILMINRYSFVVVSRSVSRKPWNFSAG
jgi:hypothetical protein